MFGLGAVLALAMSFGDLEADYSVRVDSGDVARFESVASFECPRDIWAPELLDGDTPIPIQLGPDGQLHFLVKSVRENESVTYALRNRLGGQPFDKGIWVAREGNAIRFEQEGRPIVQYHAGPSALPRDDIDPVFRRGGYLHPIWSPSGLVVTDDYPANHLHHHGVWVSWTKTEFDGRQPNFWEMGERKGTVEAVAMDRFWSGEVFGGFVGRHRYVDLTRSKPIVVLHETWQVHVYGVRGRPMPYRMFDLEFVQVCATDKPIRFPQYRYGGLGFRGPENWDGAENTRFLTGLGETDRIKGHATRAPWCHIGGEVEGRSSGIAILCHPDNYRAPQPMRIHPREPFFCYAPSQLGDWEIAPGESYVSRYRLIVFDGPPDKGVLDRFWADYARPVKVTLSERP